MEILHAPWRKKFVVADSDAKKPGTPQEECVFCKQFAAEDPSQYFLLKRYKHVVVILNLFPYNAGHILVLPLDHKRLLQDFDTETQYELIRATAVSADIVGTVLEAPGCNIGANQGDCAGGSIPSHFHMHVLPRYQRDTNFLPLIAGTKVISSDMKEIFEQLQPHFPDVL
jgi:ATP adenylyltransferase